MNKISYIGLISAAALAFAFSAQAGDRMKMDKGMMGGKSHMMLEMMDANEDGTVSKQEFNDFQAKHFSQADSNGDGALSSDEHKAFMTQMKEMREQAKARKKAKMQQKHFEKLDANGDGKISKNEFKARHEKHFSLMDHDNDGAITKEDRKYKMKKMHKKMQHMDDAKDMPMGGKEDRK